MRPRTLLPLAAGLAILAGAGCNSTDPSLPSGDVAIQRNASTLGNGAFSPNPFTESFAVRAKVKWVNADRTSGGYGSAGVVHRLVSDNGVFDSGNIPPGAAYSFTFAAVGTYAYHCSIHPTMVGSITINP